MGLRGLQPSPPESYKNNLEWNLKDEKFIKKANLHENWDVQTIPESFEYFCQILSKSILKISSYTASKLARFLRHSVQCKQLQFVVFIIIIIIIINFGKVRRTVFRALSKYLSGKDVSAP